jgi:hypothetical protein
MGVPIAMMIVLASIASFIILLRATLRSKDRSRISFAAITGMTALAYSHSLIDFSLQIPGFLVVFWIMSGCWLARSFAEESAAWRASTGKFAT